MFKFTDYETEEEQIEAIKGWWKENGKVTVFAILVTLSAYYGWIYFNKMQTQKHESASIAYDAISENYSADAVTQLKTDQPKSQYAHFAAFTAAKKAINAKDYTVAKQELQWVLDNKPNATTRAIAQQRLAEVNFQTGDYADALTAIANAPEGFEASYAELRGDIYTAQDKPAEAKAAYQKAVDIIHTQKTTNRPSLQAKLDALAGI